MDQPIATVSKTQNSPKSKGAKLLSLILILAVVAFVSYRLGASGSQVFGQSLLVNSSNQQQSDLSLISKAVDIVKQKYIDRDSIDNQKVLYGAAAGAVRAAGDEYTEFFDPKTLADFKTDLQGSFSGIGAEIGKKDGAIVIVAPLADSPAEKAGVKPKDYILKVNNESSIEWSVDETVNKIRGPEGTEVTLTLLREGSVTPFDLTITRQKIEIKSVKLEWKEFAGKKIAHLSLTRFGDDTLPLFNQISSEILAQNPAAIVLDLRSNPGGYLETSVKVASSWLPQGTKIVTEEHSQKDTIVYNSEGKNDLGKFKTVVLVNGGSASASEILAGALRDNGKAVLVGEKSFGKGSVQELVPLGDSAVKVTIAKWITPSGQHLNKDGLKPDVEVKLSDEDLKAEKDPQLEKALEEAAK